MNTICSEFHSHLNPRVNEQSSGISTAELTDGVSQFDEFSLPQVFFPELNCRYTRIQEAVDNIIQWARKTEAPIRDNIKSGMRRTMSDFRQISNPYILRLSFMKFRVYYTISDSEIEPVS